MAADTMQFTLKNDAGSTLFSFNLPLFKLDATTAPVVGDDDADGYVAGSLWADLTNDKAYICTDNGTGAAVWQEIGAGGGGTAASTTEVLTGTDAAKFGTPDSIAALWEKGTDVISAGTISLGEGRVFHITGTTTITDIDFATAKDGREAVLIFDDVLILTHDFTTLKLPTGANITTAAGDRAGITQDSGDNIVCEWYTRANGTSLAISDGDNGDITVSLGGTVWTIDNNVVTFAKMQAISADVLLGNDASGTAVEEIACTAAGRALIDDADALAQRSTLGLGTLATQDGTFSGTSSGTNTGDQTITLTGDVTGSGTGSFAATIANDAVTYAKVQNVSATDKVLGRSTSGAGDVEEIACTAAGRALIDDASAAAQRTTLGLGTLATQDGTFSGTSSGTNTGDQAAATQAEQESASSLTVFVSPGRQQFHPSAAKGWASWEMIGTWSIYSSHNVSSITDSGTGIGIVNWNVDFSASYTVLFWADHDITVHSNAGGMINQTLPIDVAGVSFRYNIGTGVATDCDLINVVAFGDQ